MISAKNFPEECEVDGDGAEGRADNPGEPEEPSPGWAQSRKYSEGEKAEQERERSKIRVVGCLAELGRAVREIDQKT
jgi:hypothetical protein